MLRFIGRNLNRYNFSELQKFGNSFLGGSNAEFLDNLLDRWSQDPNSVPATWDAYFR